MAAADYTLCDECSSKAFYDANIDWEHMFVGNVVALCRSCYAKGIRIEVVRPDGSSFEVERKDYFPPLEETS